MARVTKLLILDTVDKMLKEEWLPTLEDIRLILGLWLDYGRNIFKNGKKYLRKNDPTPNSASLLGGLINNTKTTRSNYRFWIRKGVIILERIRLYITGYSINYLIKDVGVSRSLYEETIIISEEKMWELLNDNKGKKTYMSIDNIIQDGQNTIEWSDLWAENLIYYIIYNRILFMEDFYLQQKSITVYLNIYKTYFTGENEKIKDFEKRKGQMLPLSEFTEINLYKRYLMYLNSREKNGIVQLLNKIPIKKSQLVFETDNKIIKRLSANRGDLYEAVVHGAANILPRNIEKESELGTGNLVKYTDYIVDRKIANIDNMISEKDNDNYIKAADNYFLIKDVTLDKMKTLIFALLTKLSNGSISKNTTINLMIDLFIIFDRTKDLNKLEEKLLNYFNDLILNPQFIEQYSELAVELMISNNIKNFVKIVKRD